MAAHRDHDAFPQSLHRRNPKTRRLRRAQRRPTTPLVDALPPHGRGRRLARSIARCDCLPRRLRPCLHRLRPRLAPLAPMAIVLGDAVAQNAGCVRFCKTSPTPRISPPRGFDERRFHAQLAHDSRRRHLRCIRHCGTRAVHPERVRHHVATSTKSRLQPT